MRTRPCGGNCFNNRGRYRLRRSSILEAKEEEEEENVEEADNESRRDMKEEEEDNISDESPLFRALSLCPTGPETPEISPFILRSPP